MYLAHRSTNGTLAPRVQPFQTPHHPNHPHFPPPAHTPQGAPDPCHGLAHPSHSVSPSQVHHACGGTAREVTARTCAAHGPYPDAGAPFLQPPRLTLPPRQSPQCATTRRCPGPPPPPSATACTWPGRGSVRALGCLPTLPRNAACTGHHLLIFHTNKRTKIRPALGSFYYGR